MKIVYLIEDDAFNQSGVIEKISIQIKSLSKYAEVTPICFKLKSESKASLIEGSLFVSPKFDFKNIYLNKCACELSLFQLIDKINPDIVYLRQSIWNPIYFRLFKNFKCFVEINSLDLNELKYYSFLKKLWYLAGRNWILKKSTGIIAVSNEIKTSLSQYKEKIFVSSNSISFKKFQDNFNNVLKKNNKRPQVLFTGSLAQKWQGVEKVFLLAEKLKSCDFHCVGFEGNTTMHNMGLTNLFLYNRLPKDDLDKLIKSMDIGIGTLSLYEKEMNEASPLKVREYIENHLFVIIGYIDTDFSHNDLNFVLQLPNNKENIVGNLEIIENYIFTNYKKRIDVDLYKFSAEFKEKDKINFAQNILESSK